MLRNTLNDIGIDTSNLFTDSTVNTTLAFVHTFPDGDREFSFYRNPGADMMLTEDEINTTFISQAKIFHFGTLSMTQDSVRAATKKAVKAAKESGALISFDPNLREPLWSSLELAKEQMNYGFSQCDIMMFKRRAVLDFSALPAFFVTNLLLVQCENHYFRRLIVSFNC